MKLSPLAGKPAPASVLVDIPRLLTAYYTGQPDASIAGQRVAFGTSGHRGSSLDLSFNENHVLAISQAICLYRQAKGIDGPLFIGADTHALSTPAAASALQVLAANGVEVMLSKDDEYTPTPAVSHAIICYNRGRSSGLADGIVITPSHNPPQSGGFKYNPPNGGPADSDVTKWVEAKANELLAATVVAEDGVGHSRRGRVFVVLRQPDLHAVGRQHFQRAGRGRGRQGVSVGADEQRAIDALFLAVQADGLGDGQHVVFVETQFKRSAPVPRGAEGHPLGRHGSVGAAGVVGLSLIHI